MNEELKTVNYELAYRLLMLMCASTFDRLDGVMLDMSRAHSILGVELDQLTSTYEALVRDGIVREFQNGSIIVG